MRPRCTASRASTTSWLVKALVEATPISGPAWRYTPCPHSRAIVEPTTLQMPTVAAPCSFASRTAPRVSAVSPDWLIAITRVSGSTTGWA